MNVHCKISQLLLKFGQVQCKQQKTLILYLVNTMISRKLTSIKMAIK